MGLLSQAVSRVGGADPGQAPAPVCLAAVSSLMQASPEKLLVLSYLWLLIITNDNDINSPAKLMNTATSRTQL